MVLNMSITREQLERIVALSAPHMQTVEERQAILYEIYVGNSHQPDFQLEGKTSVVCTNLVRILENDFLDTGKNALQVLLEIIKDKSGFQQKTEINEILEQIAFKKGKITLPAISITPQIFIAYSHKQALFATRLADALTELGAEVWMDVDDIATGEKWHRAIHDGLNQSKVMLLIITPDSMKSENVEAEWRYFYDKRKPLIPIRLKKTDVNYQLHSLQHIDFETQEFDVAFRKLHSKLQEWVALKDLSIPPEKPEPKVSRIPIIASLLVVSLIFVVAFVWQSFQPAPTTPTPSIEQTQTRSAETTEIAMLQTTIVAPQTRQAETENALATVRVNQTSTAQTLTRQASINAETAQATLDTQVTLTQNAIGTQEAIDSAATAENDPFIVAQRRVSSNVEWQRFSPVTQVFNSIEMVLVPAGCFDMGTNGIGGRPCFDTPFWIDRYEVSNSQFEQLQGVAKYNSRWTNDNLPRENIYWNEAYDYCKQNRNNSRLPSEAEWEYAARGVNGLNYPWAGDFDGNRLNFCDRSCIEYEWANTTYNDGYQNTAPIDAFDNGVSWVGAYQMSGNVWEWVSTIYNRTEFPYPYTPDDGREDITLEGVFHVIRGGSWTTEDIVTRSTNRSSGNWFRAYFDVGFRCARDFEG
jgi:formylglycine-generating enzyme required for sulfatase activity